MSQKDKGQSEPSMEEILASIRRIISDDKDEDAAPADAAAPAADAPTAAAADSPPAPPAEQSAAETSPPSADAEPVADSPDLPPVEGAEEMVLTEIVEDAVPEPAPAAAKPEVALPVNEKLAEEGREAFLKPQKENLPVVAESDEIAEHSDFQSLLSPPIREKSTNTLAELAGAIHARGFMLGNVAMTLEDLIRDLLRPHLKDWLDNNLPAIVERMVRAEIERLAREAESRKDLI